MPPGTAVADESVLVIARSARRVMVVVSVAVLLAGVGSVTPPGAATVAVFDKVPVAVAATVADTVNVAAPPAASVTEALIAPAPDEGQLEPAPVAAQVHVTPVSDAGNVSLTLAPVTVDGPLLVATIV